MDKGRFNQVGASLESRISQKLAERKRMDISSAWEKLQGPTAILMVSSDCNAHCRHCYLPYKGSRSPEDTLDAVKHLKEAGYTAIVAGSENLLNPDYLKSYEEAGQKDILTNGLILSQDKSLYDRLKNHGIGHLTISLHFGIEGKLRSVPERMVAEVIREAKDKRFFVQIATTITSANCNDIADMCRKAREYGADRIHFGRFVHMGKGKRNSHLKLNEIQVKSFFEQLIKVRQSYDKSRLEVRAEGYFGPRPDSVGEELARIGCYCPAGIRAFAIAPDNNVYGCPFTMGEGLDIGKYENNTIKIDSNKLVERLCIDRRDICIAHLIHS